MDKELISRWLVKAEALGYYGAWVQEQVLGTIAALDPRGQGRYDSEELVYTPPNISRYLRRPDRRIAEVLCLDEASG